MPARPAIKKAIRKVVREECRIQYPKRQTMHYALLLGGLALPINGVAATLAGSCNPVRMSTCALPFPSDLFTEADATSATGKRVVIPDATFALFANENSEQPVGLDKDVRPAAMFTNSSGFSAAAPVLFELESAVDAGSVPHDGGQILQVFEIGGNGEPVPVQVGLMQASQSKGIARKDNVIEAFPRSRWHFGGRYVAVLTHALHPQSGGDFHRSAGFQAVFDQPESDIARAHAPALATASAALQKQGLGTDDILAMTYFTVRDQAEVISPLANMIQKTYAESHAFRHWNVEFDANKYQAIAVTGQVRLSNYRDGKGGVIFDTAHPAEDYWANFILTIPLSAADTPAPVVIYGHGIGANKESMDVVDQINAERGIATFAIDQPNHGTRSERDGGYIFDILQPEGMNKVVGMVSQSSLDMVSVLAAIQQHLHSLNTLPRSAEMNLFPWLALSSYDNQPDLDLSHVYYEGTSMGGVLGSSFLGLTPKLDGAYLHVAGTGILNIIVHSELWSRFRHMAPETVTGAELSAYLGMLTQILDYGDGINSIDNARNGTTALPYPYQPFPLAVQCGMGDGIVFNNSTIALSELVDLPLTYPDKPKDAALMATYENLPMRKLPMDQWTDEDGYAVRMVQPFRVPISENSWLGRLLEKGIDLGNGAAAHGSFFSPASKAFQRAWTDKVILHKTLTTTPLGDDEQDTNQDDGESTTQGADANE